MYGNRKRLRNRNRSMSMRQNELLNAKKKLDEGYVNPFVYDSVILKCNNQQKQLKTFNTKWTCMICGYLCLSKDSLIEHYDHHKKQKDEAIDIKMEQTVDHTSYFNCAVCSRDFISLRSYEKHFDKFHGERNFSCMICEKTYKGALQLCMHNYNFHPSEDGEYRYVRSKQYQATALNVNIFKTGVRIVTSHLPREKW